MARNERIDEFWRLPNFHVPRITSHWNRLRSQKNVCFSPQKWLEMNKSTSFDDSPIFMYPGSRAVEIIFWARKLCAIAHENGQKWRNRRVLTTSNFCVPRVKSRWNRLLSQKLCAIAHENGQKWPNRRVLTTPQFSCTQGREPFKSSSETKNCVL